MMQDTVQQLCAYLGAEQFSCNDFRAAFASPNQDFHNLLTFDNIHFDHLHLMSHQFFMNSHHFKLLLLNKRSI